MARKPGRRRVEGDRVLHRGTGEDWASGGDIQRLAHPTRSTKATQATHC
jgi:hypothetical protein